MTQVGPAGLLLLVTLLAAPERRSVPLPAPGSAPWQTLRFPRIERATEYVAVELDGERAVRARSECAASARVLPLEDVDLRETPRLRWRWRIDEDVATEDPRTKPGDDFAARVYVIFPFDPEGASLWERARRRAAEILYDRPIPGQSLNYVWSELEAGTRWPSPYTASSRMISLGAGPLETWQVQEVDVRSDYVASFEREPASPLALGIMSDSDDSCGSTTAWFAGFEWRGP